MAVFSERASRRVGTEQHSQTEEYANRWKFTGHELDKETGLYYAKARFYDPKISIFLSVDPLAEQFPSWNPYHYVHQNPAKLIDPTGMCAYPPSEEEFAGLGISIENIENGYIWSDSDGDWAFNRGTKTWEGINGTDVNIKAQTQQIEAVEITNNKEGTIHSDNLQIWGVGNAGTTPNTDGSGNRAGKSLDAPGTDMQTMFDFGVLLGEMAIKTNPLIALVSAYFGSKSGSKNNTSSMGTQDTSKDMTTIRVERIHSVSPPHGFSGLRINTSVRNIPVERKDSLNELMKSREVIQRKKDSIMNLYKK